MAMCRWPTSACSSSAPRSFASDPESFGDEQHHVLNVLVIVAHHRCSSMLQRCPREGDLCKVAFSCHFALEILTIGGVLVGRKQHKGA